MAYYSNYVKALVIAAGIIVLAGLGYAGYRYVTTPAGAPDAAAPAATVPSDGPITVNGTMVCLPHRDTEGPQTLECAFGLKDEQGRYFGLQDTNPQYENISGVPMNESVTIEGTFTANEDTKYQSVGVIAVTRISRANGTNAENGWVTFSDTARGITFQYPPQLTTTYLRTFDWPPQITLTSGPLNCTEAGAPTERAGETKKRLVDDRTYCVTTVTEGAAGTIYTQYAYATQKDDQVVTLTFSLRAPQCGNYDEPKKTECENERSAFDLDAVVDRMIQSLHLGGTRPTSSLPQGYTLDKYTVEKTLDTACTAASDCETPAEYLLQSRCPFTSLCLENKCTVVCPSYK